MNLEKRVLRILFSLVLIACISTSNDTFIPTKEWQPIREGQSIPRNLHVRINMQTGEKEAKLLDKSEKTEIASVSDSKDSDNEKPNKSSTNTRINQELEEALKKIPGDVLEYSPEKLAEVKAKYKSYEQIKKDLDDVNMNVQTDSEIMKDLFKLFYTISKMSDIDDKNYFRILDDFNYLVHQLDNSLFFIDEGGLDKIILPMLVNQTNVGIKIRSLRLLGALTNNNGKAQIKVFEKNFGFYISQVLISSSSGEELSAAIYAFGCLLRKFPHAQKEILSKHGTAALISVLEKNVDIRIKAKAMTLISDLILEREESMNMDLDGASEEKKLQYHKLNIDKWLLEGRFCNIVNEFFQESRNDVIREADIAEKLIQAFQTTHNLCFSVWSESPLFRHTLLTIMNRFQESNEDFLIEISNQIDDLYEKLFGHIQIKDEL